MCCFKEQGLAQLFSAQLSVLEPRGLEFDSQATCKRTEQLQTMSGPVVHRGKDATHKTL